MPVNASSILQILVPKKRPKDVGDSYTRTYQPSNTTSALSAQDFRAHLRDIFTDRTTQDSRALLKDLVKYDSDASATIHAYLTVAKTTPRFYVYTMDGQLDIAGVKQLETQILNGLFKRNDYTTGFLFTKSLEEIAEEFRYMILLRGACASELVFNKLLLPREFRNIDVADLEWYETKPGLYKPYQKPPGATDPIPLDIPNFFVKYYRQNPTEIYPESMFVSSINTVAARQQVINDLYRIMQKTGYPRLEATVVEEVLRKNAPAECRESEAKMRAWLQARLDEVGTQLTSLRADSAYVHFDSVTPKILNEKGPGTTMDVKSIIEVLNAQNQAALKTMATVIGRGESGVNTASVEARIFSLSAESLNRPIADLFSDALTLALRMTGYQGYVVCKFDPVELRPDTELEPMRVVKQTRLLEQLSLGTITDDEFHINMNGRPRPDSAPELSGTNFMQAAKAGDPGDASPNSDPLGRSVTPDGTKSAKSKQVKK